MKNLEIFFNPKSVAVIGATDRPGSVGLGICQNLMTSVPHPSQQAGRGGQREIFFVNPFKKKVLGKKTYPKVSAIFQKIDLVLIAVPAEIVPQVIRDCAEKKVGGVIIISSGFSEVGKKGQKRQQEIKKILAEAKIPFLGPNCLGIISPATRLNASFAPATPRPGSIAFLSQSGALIDSMIDKSLEENFGFSALISYGNEADIGLNDFLEFLARDKKTKAIALYLESVKKGREFLKIARQVSKEKAIVVLKGGKTGQGKKAVASHTASLAGNPEIYSAAFKKAGIFEVETIEDLLSITLTLAQAPACQNGVAILTNGGAAGVLTADWAEKFGLKLPHLSKATLQKLRKSPAMNRIFLLGNPLDIVGDALAERYKVATEALLAQKNIHSLIFIQTLQIMTEIEKNAKIIIETRKKYPQKPILALLLGGKFTKAGFKILRKKSIPCFTEPRQAALAMKALIWRKNLLK